MGLLCRELLPLWFGVVRLSMVLTRMVNCRPLNQPFDCSWPAVIGESFFCCRRQTKLVCVRADSFLAQPDLPIPGIDPTAHPSLSWPKFYKSAISSREWDASDSAGRIKVEISAGLSEQLGGKTVFTRLETVICFSFFPVPNGEISCAEVIGVKPLADTQAEHLERCGIAWPNPAMFENPLVPKQQVASNNSGFTFPGMDGDFHKRNYSNGSANNLSSPLRGIPQPPPPSPAWGFYNFRGLQPLYDGLDARGTSMPSALNSEQISHALGSLSCAMTGPAVSASTAGNVSLPPINNFAPNTNQQLQVRLPSDQLQKLISALKSGTQHETQNPSHSQAMPPPPLPPHALAAKGAFTGQDGLPNAGHGEHYQATSTTIRNPGPRDESQGSDVSMHTACAYFPTCMTEDDAGQVIHSSPAPATPSNDIKGKKEGSSPAKREVPSSKQFSFSTDHASSPRLHVHDSRSAGKRIHNIRRRRREDFNTPVFEPSRDSRSQAHASGSQSDVAERRIA